MSMVLSSAGKALLIAPIIACMTVPVDAACPPEHGSAFAFVSSPRDLRRADGQAVRLAGTAPGLAVPLHGLYRLIVLEPKADRWGRIAGFVVPPEPPGAESINLALVRQGLSPAFTSDLPPDCIAPFLMAEAEARVARRGIWSKPGLLLAATDLEGLKGRAGLFTIVHGRVTSVRQRQRRVFLNFGAFGSERFSVIVAVSRLQAFAAGGLDLSALKGQEIEVRGILASGMAMELTTPAALVKLSRP